MCVSVGYSVICRFCAHTDTDNTGGGRGGAALSHFSSAPNDKLLELRLANSTKTTLTLFTSVYASPRTAQAPTTSRNALW